MQNKILWKTIMKNSILALFMTIIASFSNPVINYVHDHLGLLRGTGVIAFLMMSIAPLFFLSLINLILSRNTISLLGTFLVLLSLVLIVFLYRYTPVNLLTNNLIIISYLIPIFFIAATRAINVRGGYKEVIAGAVFGYLLGIALLMLFFTLFLGIASLFINIEEPIGYLGNVLMFSFVTAPFGFVFWFFISLGEQIYLKKQKVV